MELYEKIKNDIKTNPIMLFMKGTKDMPMCGFSATIVNILNAYDVDYEATNVLEDPEIRIKLSELEQINLNLRLRPICKPSSLLFCIRVLF